MLGRVFRENIKGMETPYGDSGGSTVNFYLVGKPKCSNGATVVISEYPDGGGGADERLDYVTNSPSCGASTAAFNRSFVNT